MIAYNICKGENETGKRRKETSWAVWNIAFNLLACDLAVGLRYLLERSHYTEQITETEKERERWRENLDHTQEYSWCSCRSDLKRCMPPFLNWMQALFSRIFAQIFYLAFRLYFRCMLLPSIESIENGVFFRFRITFSVLFFIPNLFGCLAQCREMLPVVHLAAFSNEINHSFILHNCRKRVAFT